MSSVYGKLRKAAKEKTKGSRLDGTTAPEAIVQKDIPPIDPISAEELNELLGALKENPAEVLTALETTADEVVAELRPKYFTAYGVYYDSARKKFVQISIDYDPKTCYTAITNSEDIADSNAVATVKMMKTISVKLGKNEEII